MASTQHVFIRQNRPDQWPQLHRAANGAKSTAITPQFKYCIRTLDTSDRDPLESEGFIIALQQIGTLTFVFVNKGRWRKSSLPFAGFCNINLHEHIVHMPLNFIRLWMASPALSLLLPFLPSFMSLLSPFFPHTTAQKHKRPCRSPPSSLRLLEGDTLCSKPLDLSVRSPK